MQRHRTKLMGALLGVTMLGIGSVGYYYLVHRPTCSSAQGPISSYKAARDRKDILALFCKNLYWLVADPNHDMAYTLDHHAAYHHPLYWDLLSIDVLRDKEHGFIGFVAYYKTKPEEGKVLFLAVKEEFRGKQYGRQLLEHAIAQLRAQGAHTIILAVRTDNMRGLSFYARAGFREVWRKDGFAHLAL